MSGLPSVSGNNSHSRRPSDDLVSSDNACGGAISLSRPHEPASRPLRHARAAEANLRLGERFVCKRCLDRRRGYCLGVRGAREGARHAIWRRFGTEPGSIGHGVHGEGKHGDEDGQVVKPGSTPCGRVLLNWRPVRALRCEHRNHPLLRAHWPPAEARADCRRVSPLSIE